MAEERMNRSEQKGDRRKCGHQQCGEPEPPFTSQNLLRVGAVWQNAEIARALEGRGFWLDWLACGYSQDRFHFANGVIGLPTLYSLLSNGGNTENVQARTIQEPDPSVRRR